MSLARVNNLQTKPSPRTIWARVLYDLKEKREYELHSVCLNLDKVALNGNLFVITVYDQKTLDKLQNSKVLVASLASLGYNYNVSVILGESEQDKQNKKIAHLQSILGYNTKIKQGD